jgi:hypothetical protein
LIKTRCVISIGDYEPINVTQQFVNFQKGLQRFAQTWYVRAGYSAFRMEAEGAVAVWNVETKAPNWTVKTQFRLLNWSDIVRKDFRQWNPGRIWRAVRAFANFVISGTCWNYFRLNWRFGLFFLYPALTALLFTIAALWFAILLGSFSVPFAPFIALAIGVGLFAAFIKWIDPLVLSRVVDLWIFLYELVHLERAGLAERLGIFSQDLIAQLQSDYFDEIIVVGHGIGAVLQPIIVDRAFWALPEFGKDGRSINLLSLGSLLLAVGLHPEGGWVVAPASRIARDKWVRWAEYQAEEDILSFPGRNPITELISDHGTPVLYKVRAKHMADIDPKRHFPETAYRNHRQLVRANSKRYFYDYFMICCGPFSLSARMKYPDIMVSAFAADGSLVADR